MGIPSLIICGSRGSQVTIGLVWRHFWRGPTILINAGSLTSETFIPVSVYPVLITMENDYFQTKSLDFVKAKFSELSEVDGTQIHIRRHGHMPNLDPDIFLYIVTNSILRQIPDQLPTHKYKVIKLMGKNVDMCQKFVKKFWCY